MRLFWLLAALASGYAQEGGVIEGTVSEAGSHAPLANAQVRVFIPSLERSASTDATGAYRIEGLPAGDYNITFRAEAHVPASRSAVRLGPGSIRVNAELWRQATVSGRVLDDDGRAAVNVTVSLYRARSGQPVNIRAGPDGAYAFSSVAPGVYIVQARPPGKVDEGSMLAPTWYPGFVDRTQADRVIVRAGAELSGLEIRLQRVPVRAVEGAVIDEAGHPLEGVTVRLRPPDEWQPEEASTVSGSEGVFRFPAVRPGQWRIAGTGAGREGFATVVLDKRDMTGLRLTLFPPFALRGFVERDEPRDAQGKRKVSGVSLVPDAGQGKQVLAFHEQDGTIRFSDVQPGRYTIFPVGYIPGYYVESVRLGDREVMSQPVDLHDGAIPFRVIYRANAGRVRGTVEKGAGSTVVLLPQDEALLDGQFIRTAKCDEIGRFEAGSLRPGDYYALAFDRVDQDALTDVTFVRNLKSAAVSVHVEAGKASDTELKLTLWPE